MNCLNPIVLLILTVTSLSAQTVKLKKQIVYIDDAATFSFAKKAMGNELYVYNLNTKEELVNMIVDNNKTESKVDDSKKIVFTKLNTIIQSKNFRGRDWEFMLALLLSEKVFDLKGEINLENLKRFTAKYDDRNINHTMMR
ncbi:hypothetical protein [Flavobacterium sp.]|uniref:hypothetical protein n=1 Tax=Flavobacterium sp. TaxID=239 RepID=UPI002487B3A3|nr:hypothetical protein [Flavobacterium sp.]MDI1317931.1 hypothetical protein [Flavobacterium sp.]